MKLTIIGGGGFRVPQVFEAVSADDAPVRIDELSLYDVSESRLTTIRAIIDELAQRTKHSPRITVTQDLTEALRDADFVFSAVRIGGTAGRISDERTALDLGVLGQETVGPGGLAYALRTIPFMVKLAEIIREVAPEAWVINFTNPAGMVTEAMRGVLGDRVVGICDTPIGLMRRAVAAVSATSASGATPPPLHFDYVGLNLAAERGGQRREPDAQAACLGRIARENRRSQADGLRLGASSRSAAQRIPLLLLLHA
jgi:6-phospho-beta-glucosidase